MKLTVFAKELRKSSTDVETFLWHHLRARRFEGLKFKRQEPIGKYIVDFVCHEKWLIIECDGGQHDERSAEDQKRDTWLKGRGYRVLRFWNNEVLQNLNGTLKMIWEACQSSPSP